MRNKSNINDLVNSLSQPSNVDKQSALNSTDQQDDRKDQLTGNPAVNLASGKSVKRAPVERVPVLLLDHDQITIFKYHDRHQSSFETQDFNELRESVGQLGQKFPGVVRKTDRKTSDGRMVYELIVGRMRLEATRGKTQFRAYLQELSDAQAIELMVVENAERRDPTAFERWLSIIPIRKDGVLDDSEIARIFKFDKGNLSRYLKAIPMYENTSLDEVLNNAENVSMNKLLKLNEVWIKNKNTVNTMIETTRYKYPNLANDKFIRAVLKMTEAETKPNTSELALSGSVAKVNLYNNNLTISFKGLPDESEIEKVIEHVRKLGGFK